MLTVYQWKCISKSCSSVHQTFVYFAVPPALHFCHIFVGRDIRHCPRVTFTTNTSNPFCEISFGDVHWAPCTVRWQKFSQKLKSFNGNLLSITPMNDAVPSLHSLKTPFFNDNMNKHYTYDNKCT